MDETPITPTPEEAKADAEAIAEVKEDELRTKLADELGIDPEEESALLDKLVAKEKANHEKLSGAIKQKINWREKANTAKKPDGEKPKDGKIPEKTTEELVNEALEKRDLESLSIPDDIKTEIRELSKIRGISVKEAAKLPYILARISEAEKKERIEAASATGGNKGKYASSFDPSKPLDPSNYDLSTEEGRKSWNEAKAARRKYTEENA